MSDELQILQYRPIMEVRMLVQDGEPWWVLKDVCQVLNIVRGARVAERLDEDEVRQTYITDSLSREQKTTIINESGLYSVILRSDKPEAKSFKRWVTHEVLPSIRRTGTYDAKGRNQFTPLDGPLRLTGAEPLPFTKTAQLLWLTLLELDRRQGGAGKVQISNEAMIQLLGVASLNTLRAARKALSKAGYITFSPGTRANSSTYQIVELSH